jgi:hypothetical protein
VWPAVAGHTVLMHVSRIAAVCAPENNAGKAVS